MQDYRDGQDLNYYYNPSNPDQGKFIGGNSSASAIHSLIGLSILALVALWGIYLYKKLGPRSNYTK